MKTKILAALKTKYNNLGLSDKAFDGVAALLVKTITKDEEIEAGIAGAEVETLLKSIQSSVDAERTKATNAAKALEDYKKLHPEQGGGGENPEVQQLKADLEKQKSELDTLKADYENQIKQGKFNALRDQVKGKADELNVSNVPIWNDVVAGVEIKDDSTVDTILEAVKTAYEAKLTAYIGEGAAPYRGDGSPKPAEISAEDRARKAKEDADRVRNNS